MPRGPAFKKSRRISPLIIDIGHVLGDLVHEVDDEALVLAAAPDTGVVLLHQERLVLKEG